MPCFDASYERDVLVDPSCDARDNTRAVFLPLSELLPWIRSNLHLISFPTITSKSTANRSIRKFSVILLVTLLLPKSSFYLRWRNQSMPIAPVLNPWLASPE